MKVRAWHKLLVLAVVLFCLLALGAIIKRSHNPTTAEASGHAVDAGGVTYAAVAPVKRETIATSLAIAGQFMPYQNVELHAKVAGYIKHIYVDIGDHVHEGQVLAVLEIPELVAQVDEARAAMHHAEEEIQRSESEVSRAQADEVALHANAQRLVNTDKARPGLIAQQELDDATAKDRAAEAQVDAAKSALAAAKQQLEVAKANQQHYTALNDYAKITAPYDGVITWRFSDTGALVQAGTSNTSGLPVVTVAEVNVLRLRIPVPESLAAKIRIGDSADVHVQATGEHFTGKVERFTDSLDPSTRTMQVEIDVANPNYHLQPGMYADVRLQVQSHKDALSLPVQAVQRSNGKASVLLVDDHDRVRLREIKTGVEDPTRVEVLSGVSDGDRVIVGNFNSYQPGEQVKPRPMQFAYTGGEPSGGNE
jgi:RND family efflux transporter MFP subunit